MKKKNQILSLILITFMFFGMLAGCTQPTSSEAEQSKEDNIVEQKGDFPLTVTDATGFDMTIEKKPEAIISLTLGTDEMLLSMIDHDKIKALCGAIADDEGISNIADEAVNFEKAENNIETVISLSPDIVFAADWMEKEAIQQMRDANIPVYCTPTPANIEDQKKVIQEIAHVIGEDAKAQEMVDGMDAKLKEIEDKIKELNPEDKLTVMNYNSYGNTSGAGTTFDDIVTRAGLINAVAEAGLEPYANISKEKIIEINPDVLILPAWSYDKKEDPEDFAEEIKKDKSLASVNAIKNDRVYMIPDKHMTTISQYIVLGVEDIAKAVYPELF